MLTTPIPTTPTLNGPIHISRVHFPVTTLGPGRRLGIWLQGCSIRCPGCISADTWESGGATSVSAVLAHIQPWLQEADGITISGGEPFDQADALFALLSQLELNKQQNVLVYSGYPLEKINHTAAIKSGLIDALMSDPFELAQPQTLALRGSDNQRLHLLTARGRAHFSQYQRPLNSGDRALDIMFDPDGSVWLAGIPARDDMHKLSALLATQGHHIITTDDKRSL